jgi:acid phosphatase type 7
MQLAGQVMLEVLRWRLSSLAGGGENLGIRILLAMLFLLAAANGVKAQQSTGTPKPAKKKTSKSSAEPDTYTLVGAGDIAWCGNLAGAEATAKLIDKIPGTVFAAGDLAYEKGTYEEFENCYQPTWGRFRDRTKPSPGNHEYVGSVASGYFRYWGAQAGDPEKGYYSFDLGSWHIISLNTNCEIRALGGCGEGSPEEVWLKKDLAEHPKACIIAYGHHALFSSGISSKHARHEELRAFWKDLYAAHADLVLAGHEHSYERFAPQDPSGHADSEDGIRQITAGTGGRSHTFLGFAMPNSEVRNADTFGVLKLTLSPTKYKWEFIPEAGGQFHDSGEGSCHNATPSSK